jgi:hypothetical protein
LGIGDWGLGIGDWGLGPIPNPQSPIPKNQNASIKYKLFNKINKLTILILKLEIKFFQKC